MNAWTWIPPERTLLQAAGEGRRMNSLEIYCLQCFQHKMKSLMNKLRKMKPPFSISSMMYNSTKILKPSLPSWPCLISVQCVLTCNSLRGTCFRYVSHWVALYLSVILACNYLVSVNILQNILLSHFHIITGQRIANRDSVRTPSHQYQHTLIEIT